MNTIELQHKLIQKILNVSDNQFLDYLNTIISENSGSTVYELSEFEKELVMESRKDYTAGKVISNKDVFSKTEKWLNE